MNIFNVITAWLKSLIVVTRQYKKMQDEGYQVYAVYLNLDGVDFVVDKETLRNSVSLTPFDDQYVYTSYTGTMNGEPFYSDKQIGVKEENGSKVVSFAF